MAPKKDTHAQQDAQPKQRRTPAERALDEAEKARARAAEAQEKAAWLSITSSLHSALARAEARDPVALASILCSLGEQVQPFLPPSDDSEPA